MKAIITALAFATALGALAAPASAQGTWTPMAYEAVRDHRPDHHRWGGRGWDRRDMVSERRIARIVHREGFAEIDDIRLRRDRYIVHATRPNGALFRLLLDAYDGRLLTRERIGWSRGHDRLQTPAWRGSGIEFRLNF